MPDDQALIEAFIEKNGVKKIPTGVSATYPDYKWDGKNLTPRVSQHWKNTYQRGPKISPEVAKRRIRVVDLAQKGMTVRQIADHLGVDRNVIYHDTKVLGLKTATPRRGGTPGSKKAAKAASQKAIREAFDGKKTVRQIVAETGLGKTTVLRHLKEMGLKCPVVAA